MACKRCNGSRQTGGGWVNDYRYWPCTECQADPAAGLGEIEPADMLRKITEVCQEFNHTDTEFAVEIVRLRADSEKLRSVIREFINLAGPCDIRLGWCHIHRQSKCDGEAIIARARQEETKLKPEIDRDSDSRVAAAVLGHGVPVVLDVSADGVGG